MALDVKAELEKNFMELQTQQMVLERQADFLNAQQYEKGGLPEPKETVTVFNMQMSDGSWPAIPLLQAKAQVLSALAILNYKAEK